MSYRNARLPLLLLAAGLTLIGALLLAPPSSPPVALSQSYPAPGSATPATGYPPPTGQETPTATTAATTPTPTRTARPTATLAVTATQATTVVADVPQVVQPPTPTVTPTPIPPGALQCVPGEPLLISGTAPPRAPLLLFFGERIVGGASAGPSGEFAIPLVPGIERSGEYVISVRVRGTDAVVAELTCTMPAVTPTPVPTVAPLVP